LSVVRLEEMAARAAAEMEAKARAEKERLTAADKTLPLPPVPSGKPSGYGVNRLPVAQEIFQQEPVQDEENEEADAGPVPRTPSLSALSILRPPLPRERPVFLSHGVRGEADSGLDALERRLVQEVGTRKHPSLPPPDVRAVLSPISTDTPPPPPVPVPLPVPGKSMAQEQADDVGAAVNESAISSLALGTEEDFGGRKANVDVMLPSVGGEPEEEAEGDDADADGRTHRQGKGTGASSGSERGTHKARSRKSVKSVKSDSKERDREKDKERRGKKKKDKREARDDDAVRLRRAAKGRVAEWLGNLEAHEPVPEPEVTSEVNPDLSSSPKLATVPRVEPAPAPEVDFASPTTTPVVVSQPNPRSSGFIPVATLRRAPISLTPAPASVRRLARRYPAIPIPAVEAKYDVKSARGGRGGQVTAVASIWAEAAKAICAGTSTLTSTRATPEGPNSGNARTRTVAANKPTSTPTPIKPMTVAKDEDKRVLGTAAAGKERDPPRAPRTLFGLGSAAAATLSSPALSSSIATPVLSSTASLARPPLSPTPTFTPFANRSDSSPPSSQLPRPKPHPHSQSLTPSPAVGQQRPPVVNGGGFKTEFAFGQARLRDLIKRYQGQAS
jgi:hypothetical protein